MTNNSSFDRSKAFKFYGSWMNNLTRMEKFAPKEPHPAYELFKAIANYSLYGKEPDFSKLGDNELMKEMAAQAFEAMKPNIDASLERRERAFNTGGKNQEALVMDYKKEHPDATYREIEKRTGVPHSTAHKIVARNDTFSDEYDEAYSSAGDDDMLEPAW